MSNPYSVLGVERNATDEQIKAAYKALALKYAPENYSDSPLSDLASNKMDEINAAYDQIMSERRLGSSQNSSSGTNNGYYTQSYSSRDDLNQARSYMQANNTQAAENILFNVPDSARNAEWNFLMGRCCQQKGWLTEAKKYYTNAVNMEPGNAEYQNALRNSSNSRQSQNNMNGNPYNRGYTVNSSTGGCSGCDVCTGLICTDCCCECMGGDFIRCC